LQFSANDIAWLRSTGRFKPNALDYFSRLRFTGDVHAMSEGTTFFANEPILRITAPLPQAQLVETRLINILHFQSLVAAKAARCVLAAPNKVLVDFGLRRAHGAEAGLMAARASYIAGFAGTATVLAGEKYGIPLYGTMAHSFVEAFNDESAAFETYARSRPNNLVFLIDTYDTEAAARKVVTLAPKLKADGIVVRAVRLDSGDLIALSKSVRNILDQGGLHDVTIFASGGLDEDSLVTFAKANAPIDGIGIGTSLTTSADVPNADFVYKMQEHAGLPRRKKSDKKATWPGRKQVWRRRGADHAMSGDVLALENSVQSGEPLLQLVMQSGKRVAPSPSLDNVRQHAKRELELLPESLRRIDSGYAYPVEVADELKALAAEVDRRMR
jgi:nicotinate phosphoribosyltransferase